MIDTNQGLIQNILSQDKDENYFFSFKHTPYSFILYEHLLLDDLSREKETKKLVRSWRADITSVFVKNSLKKNSRSTNGKLNINEGFRLYIFMAIASKFRNFDVFRPFSRLISSLEDFEIMYWYWRIQINYKSAVNAFVVLFEEN